MKYILIVFSLIVTSSVFAKKKDESQKSKTPVSRESKLKINEVVIELNKELKASDKINKRRIYELLSTAAKRLDEKFSKEELISVLKFYEQYNEIDTTHYFVEMFVDLYEKKKKDFDSAIQESLSPKQKEEFLRKLKIAITESNEGNG